MREFLRIVWNFLKEVVMFGVDAFFVAAAREIGKRFMHRLKARGGDIAAFEASRTGQLAARSPAQTNMSFLDEYRD